MTFQAAEGNQDEGWKTVSTILRASDATRVRLAAERRGVSRNTYIKEVLLAAVGADEAIARKS